MHTMVPAKPTLIALILGLLGASAQAGAPMATEDADTLAPRECEWETQAERQRRASRGWSSQVGCGWLVGFQAGLGYAQLDAEGVRSEGLTLGGKWALRVRPEGGLGLTLAWEFASLKEPGHRHRADASTLTLVATQALGAAGLLHLNLGSSHSRLAHQTERFWALGAEWTLAEGLDLLAETYGSEHAKPRFGLGLRLQAGEAWSLGLMASREREAGRAGTLRLSVRWGF